MSDETSISGAAMSLDQVRARLDVIDTEMLQLVDERSTLAAQVAAAKRAAGNGDTFGLRVAREAQILRRLLATPRQGASTALTVRLWRELIGDSLSRQGPFHLSICANNDLPRLVELARFRFGSAPPITVAASPDDAIAAARTHGGVAVLSLHCERPWWGRLLAEPQIKVFAALPCLAQWGSTGALAVGKVDVEPTGADQTFWVTDAAGPAGAIQDKLGQDGVAADLIADAWGLKLFVLGGYYMADDERLGRAPGQLSGVIGAAPLPFDV